MTWRTTVENPVPIPKSERAQAASQLIEAERPKTITYMDDMTDEEIAAELGDLPAFFAGRKRGNALPKESE